VWVRTSSQSKMAFDQLELTISDGAEGVLKLSASAD
jgi:hypothetical protein